MTLDLTKIKLGTPGITPVIGASLYEGCVVSLKRQKHEPNQTALKLKGDTSSQYNLEWQDVFDEQMDRAWNDQQYATEYGATCIAILLTLELTDYTVINRSRKGTGFDYWLGKKDDELLNNSARLEVSGIFDSPVRNALDYRFNDKIKQTNPSDSLNLPAYVGVVEFKNPSAKFGKK